MKEPLKGRGMTLLRFLTHTKTRKKIFRKAPGTPMPQGQMNKLAQELHPHNQSFVIKEVRQESSDTRTYLLKSVSTEKPAFFKAGQYLSFSLDIQGSTVRRPFSISSSPDKTLDGEIEVTIRKTDPAFASSVIYDSWKVGDTLQSSGPAGEFSFSPLRDQKTLIFVGGGSGITPFRSLVSDILTHYSDRRILLFHGAVTKQQFLFLEEFRKTESLSDGRFFYIPVCSGEGSDWSGEKGFIDVTKMRSSLQKYFPEQQLEECSFFICGPPAMEANLRPQLEALQIPRKQIRRENFSVPAEVDEFSVSYTVLVRSNRNRKTIQARSDESLLVALERAGLRPPSLCRAGTCGWCRSRLISGKVKRAAGESGLRLADEKFSHIHPCSEYPRSDLEIYIPDEPTHSLGGKK